MKAFVLQLLCIWCQSGSFFMTVQTVIRVCPYKELLPLMGLVWIYYWRTHTSSVVWGGGSESGPPDRDVFELVSVVLPHSDTAESKASFIGQWWSSLVCKLSCSDWRSREFLRWWKPKLSWFHVFVLCLMFWFLVLLSPFSVSCVFPSCACLSPSICHCCFLCDSPPSSHLLLQLTCSSSHHQYLCI